jgi:hypothetical protein
MTVREVATEATGSSAMATAIPEVTAAPAMRAQATAAEMEEVAATAEAGVMAAEAATEERFNQGDLG